jgi:hypothetical protein
MADDVSDVHSSLQVQALKLINEGVRVCTYLLEDQ